MKKEIIGMRKYSLQILLAFLLITLVPLRSFAWFDETHIAIAKVPDTPNVSMPVVRT
jgi:hypothetical protein